MLFANPELLSLLVLLPAVLWWSLRARRRGVARFSSLRLLAHAPFSPAVKAPLLLGVLRCVGLALLIVALARPQTTNTHVAITGEGISIQLVIDNSASMKTRDYDMDSAAISRLDAVKYSMRLFIGGDGYGTDQAGEHGLSGRPNDRIGMITFSRDPEVICPSTLDHQAALEALEGIRLAPPVGTNIGDAVAWALDRLRRDPCKERVIILLSDGAHNIKNAMQPLEAADLAAALKIKVYTIGAVGNRYRPNQVRKSMDDDDAVDEPTMQEIASRTGGQYFRATDTTGLTQIYQEIDRLETTKIEKKVHKTVREWYLIPLIPGLLLLVVEQILLATRFLRVP
jgi:Ca-activated chloride channel homolog